MQIGIGLGQDTDAAKAAAQAAKQAKKAAPKYDLALAFASVYLDQEAVHRTLCEELNAEVLLGCSSFAEITPAGVTQESVVVMLLKLDGAKISFAQAPVTSRPYENGEILASQLAFSKGPAWPLGLMFTGMSSGYENETLRALSERLGRFPIFGGMGSGKYDLGMSDPEFWAQYQYIGPKLDSKGSRLALIEFPKEGLRPAFGFEHGWQPVGPEAVVTKCKGHKVYEVGGIPVLDYYRQFLGGDHKDEFFELMIQRYGFAMMLEGRYEGASILKLPVRTDFKEGYIEYFPAEDMKGRRVRLIQASRHGLIEGARQAALRCQAALDGLPPAFVFMVSCCARQGILNSRVANEFCAVRDVFGPDVPIFGYYSGGEIAPFLSHHEDVVDPKNPFCGSFYHTTTIGLLAIGAKKAARVGGITPKSVVHCDPALQTRQLSKLLAKSEDVLDSTESFLSNLSRKSYRDGEILRRQNLVIHRYTPHSVYSRITENVAKGLYEVVDTEFSGCFMFLDVKGFTAFSEEHPGAEVVKALNELFDPATQLIYENGGDVDKFIGDCIFAAFKTPADALRCGRKLLELFSRLKKKDSPFSVRIGISGGRAVRANVGSKDRREYTYIGDAVNLAQRLEDSCSPGKLLISEALFDKAGMPFSEVQRKEILVKGKRKPVVCYECAP